MIGVLVAGIGLDAGPAPAAEIVSYAIVQDDATLRVRGKTIRLFGIYVVDTRRACSEVFRPVRCKPRAAGALDSKIRGFVSCEPMARHPDGSLSAVCHVEEGSILDPPVDLGAWLIEQGLAVALPDAPFEYHTLEKIARVNRRGVWGFQVDRIR